MSYRKNSTSQYQKIRPSQGYQLNFDRFHSDDGMVACRYCDRLQDAEKGSLVCPVPKKKEVAEIEDEVARAKACEFFKQWKPKKEDQQQIDLVECHCPECGSSSFVYRKRTDDFRCRKCGEIVTPTL